MNRETLKDVTLAVVIGLALAALLLHSMGAVLPL